MKIIAAISLLAASASAFSVDSIPGAIAPTGLFDPLGFAAKADEPTLKRYREAELTHGRVAMLATIGFLSTLSSGFLLGAGIAKAETQRAEIGWVEPKNVPFDKPGLLRDTYVPGDIGFDPLGLKPEDPEEFFQMQTKELQNGRLAMLWAGCWFPSTGACQGKGIIENLLN
ncbi:b binding protein L1818, chloroplastic [Seminavis robusta]|uniref:B binding protein L1818, chloroplastic n=1 Tax=Seminavis robusta TaxID=568900 RepID=A0A9N8EIV6_9STRA|nr:b binding protein L1818, chloroplastic [Seminavis robusta]|eukprot:Sro1207_g252450.1 b binding protein L1818, chloroplastic (171) ;mRNA; r:10848-11541